MQGCENIVLGSATGLLFAASVAFLVLALRDRLRDNRARKGDDDNGIAPDPRHGITFLVCFLAFLAYFVMWVSGGNGSPLSSGARYADWLVTTPLLLLDLLWVVGRGRPYDVAGAVVLDVLMILLGIAAVLTVMSGWARYAMWGLSSLAMLGVFAYLVSFRGAGGAGPDAEKARFEACLPWILVLWSVYPAVWLAGKEGTGVMGACAEAGSYAVLDVLAKAGFGAFLLSFDHTRP